MLHRKQNVHVLLCDSHDNIKYIIFIYNYNICFLFISLNSSYIIIDLINNSTLWNKYHKNTHPSPSTRLLTNNYLLNTSGKKKIFIIGLTRASAVLKKKKNNLIWHSLVSYVFSDHKKRRSKAKEWWWIARKI